MQLALPGIEEKATSKNTKGYEWNSMRLWVKRKKSRFLLDPVSWRPQKGMSETVASIFQQT